MMADKLVKIERYNWPALRDLFAPNSPATFVCYNLVDNFIRWTEQEPDFPNLVFYSLNGDWRDGTFAAIHCEIIYIYSLAASSERLQNLLRLFDPSKGLKIHSIMNKDRAAILDVVESKNLQISCNLESLLHHLPSADALKFDVTPPEGITLKSIENSDVDFADAVYIYRKENVPGFLHLLAKFNLNVGAYNSDGHMIAWVFRVHNGLIGALQVEKDFYGRGLGILVSKVLSRKIAETGHDIGANIFAENAPSLSIFKKMGFRIVDKLCFIETIPLQ